MLTLIKKILRGILLVPVLLVLLFEEWGWEPLARFFGRLARLPLWAKLESDIKSLPPRAALMLFGVPVIALIPVKLLALYLFGRGHAVLGITLVIATKITGTAVVARLFQLTEPAMMRLAWFARIYTPWKAWKNRVLTQVRQSAPWRAMCETKARIKILLSKLWSNISKQ